MTQRILVAALLPLLVIALAGVSQAWQGRVGDPYGLLQDETYSLTHSAESVQGDGVRFYPFPYTDVMDWDYDLDRLDAPLYSPFDTLGQGYSHNAPMGADFLLDPVRMGSFLSYGGMRGDYDSDEVISGTEHKDLDKLGEEAHIACRQEEHVDWQQINLDGDGARKAPADAVLKILEMDKARIEWSTGGGACRPV